MQNNNQSPLTQADEIKVSDKHLEKSEKNKGVFTQEDREQEEKRTCGACNHPKDCQSCENLDHQPVCTCLSSLDRELLENPIGKFLNLQQKNQTSFIKDLLAAKDREADERVLELEKYHKFELESCRRGGQQAVAEAVRLERERYHAIVDDAFGWVVTPMGTKNPYDTYLFDKMNSARNKIRQQILNPESPSNQ